MSILLECPSCRRKFRVKEDYAARRFKCPSCGRELPISDQRLQDHDVFISYSAEDKSTADAVRMTLEKKGIRCWIAPRDILPGADWGEAIIDAIERGRLMVLVLSADANKSPQVKREVERAVSKGVSIVPVRIDDGALSKSMEYFLSAQHWFDAFPPPLARHLPGISDVVEKLLSGQRNHPRVPGTIKSPVADGSGHSEAIGSANTGPLALIVAGASVLIGFFGGWHTHKHRRNLIVAGGSILIGLAMIVLIIVLWPQSKSNPQSISRPPESAAQPSANAILGTWKLKAESLRTLDPIVERAVRAGAEGGNLEEVRRKFREFRLKIEPMSHPNELRLVMLGRNESPVRATLSSSDDGKHFEGPAGPFIATVEMESAGTLKAKGVPYSLLQDEFAYERAE
jgi:predicted RNA-binding Zn-ribbon protein involved in translation (DUF1610 family)